MVHIVFLLDSDNESNLKYKLPVLYNNPISWSKYSGYPQIWKCKLKQLWSLKPWNESQEEGW